MKTKTHLKRKVTKEEILQLLKYDKDTGYFYWRLPRGSMAKAGDLAGTDTGNGIIKINVNGRRYHRSHLVWFIETGKWPMDQILHNNRDRSNDWISNLREASIAEIHWNDKIKFDDEPDGLTQTEEGKTVVIFEKNCFGVFKSRLTAEQMYRALNKLKGILNGHK